MMIAPEEEAIFAQNCLDREIQRYVEQFLLGFRSHCPYEPYVIFNVFKHVQHEEQVEKSVALIFSYVAQAKAKILIATARAHAKRVGRNVVTIANTIQRKMGLQGAQYQAGTASNVAHAFWGQLLSFDHSQNLSHFER